MSLSKNPSTQLEWESHIKAQQLSGLSRAAYCKQQGLAYHRFKYWARLSVPADASQKTKLIPIKVAESNTTTVLASIELKDGQRLLIHSAQLVKQLLQGGV